MPAPRPDDGGGGVLPPSDGRRSARLPATRNPSTSGAGASTSPSAVAGGNRNRDTNTSSASIDGAEASYSFAAFLRRGRGDARQGQVLPLSRLERGRIDRSDGAGFIATGRHGGNPVDDSRKLDGLPFPSIHDTSSTVPILTAGAGPSGASSPPSRSSPPSPPKPAARARFASDNKSRMTRFREMMHDLVEQMSMTPAGGTTTTGTTDSGITPSDLEAGTVGTGKSYTGMSEGDRAWSGDKERSVSWTRRSWRDGGSGHGYSFSTDDAGGGGGSLCRRDRKRRRQRRESGSGTEDEPAGPMSYVVVENSFDAFIPDEDDMDAAEKHVDPDERRLAHSTEAEAGSQSAYTSYLNSETSSRRLMKRRRKFVGMLNWCMGAMWLKLKHFIDSSFPDPKVEKAFRKEEWYANKRAAILATFFLVLQWMVTIAVQPSLSLWRKYAYIGICGFWTLPLPLLVAFDGPRRFKWLYQVWVAGACWCWGWILTVEMYSCGFYRLTNNCGGRPFLHLLASLLANASFAVMSLGQNRGLHVILATVWFVTGSSLFPRLPKTPMSWWRDVIVFELFHVIISIMSYYRERSDRQLFSLRAQLKEQYRAVQSAQVQERRAEDSKKRFVSYIFHEVRVPLNTARLALANLDGEGAFHEMSTDQKELVIGLDGSLRMMEKVLNDVLSFNRMESGNLIQARKPFNVHKAVHYVALSHRATAELTGLEFELELDPRIDEIGGTVIGDEMRFKQVCSNLVSNAFKFTASGGVKVVTKLLFPVLPECGVEVEHLGGPHDASTATMLGTSDETVVHDTPPDEIDMSDLLHRNGEGPASAKSSENGRKRVSLDEKAQLTYDFGDRPGVINLGSPKLNPATFPKERRHSLPTPTHTPRVPLTTLPSRSPASQSQTLPAPTSSVPRKALIRVEVHDTGVGLSLSDVRDNRLFSPYVQTEIGRRQGGKGSGLGLALVMQIVKLSKGRLGVDSELGKGSVFWFEIPYTLSPHPSQMPASQPQWLASRRISTPSPRGSISIAIAGPRRRSSAPDTASLPNVPIGGSSGGPKTRSGTPLQTPLFNLLPFTNPSLVHGPTVADQSPMTRTSPLIPHPSSLPASGRETPVIDEVESELDQRRHTPSSAPGLPRVVEVDLRTHPDLNPPESPNSLGISNPFVPPLVAPATPPRPALNVNVDAPVAQRMPHASLLGRTPSLVPYQVPRMTQSPSGAGRPRRPADPHFRPVIPDSPPPPPMQNLPILPAYTGSEGSRSPTLELDVNPLSLVGQGLAADTQGQRSASGGTAASAEPEPEEPLTVLVVDDDALTRKLMTRMLKRNGHTVLQAGNGQIALDMILASSASDPIDIVFLDNQMPLMTGVEVARAVRAHRIETYIVGCTGNALREDQDEYLSAGADDIIPKPVSGNAIAKRLAEARRRRREMMQQGRAGGVQGAG